MQFQKYNMSANFIKLESADQLESLLEKSSDEPVVLLKHSNSCGTSFHILEQAEQIDGDVHVLVVQENRPLSAQVAELTGHRHHSPQAFVIKDGRVVYHATHYGIDPEAIQERLNLK